MTKGEAYAPAVRHWTSSLLAVALVAAACVPDGGGPGSVGSGTGSDPEPGDVPVTPSSSVSAVDPIRIGTGPEAESILLAHVLAELVREEDVPARVVEFADADDARRALEVGDVDVEPGYTGEAWLTVLGRADPPSDARTSYARVREFDEPQGILWPRPAFARVRSIDEPPADATFAFVVAGPPGVDADLATISELASRLAEQPDAQLCVDPGFAGRPDGLVAVLDAYDVRREVPVLGVSPEDAVLLVRSGVCMAGLTTATDGGAWLRGLRPLLDDLGIFPAFVVASLLRDEVREEYPVILGALAPFSSGLTTARLGAWNGRVAAGEPVEEVATDAAFTLLELAGRQPTPRDPATPSPTDG